MNENKIKELLSEYKEGSIDDEKFIAEIKNLPYAELDYAKIDNHREIRNGYPEVIYSEGKSIKHILGIVETMMDSGEENILLTRASHDVYDALKEKTEDLKYYEDANIVVVKPRAKSNPII